MVWNAADGKRIGSLDANPASPSIIASAQTGSSK